MKALGYYAKDKKTNNLFQFEHGAGDEFYIINQDGDKVMRDPKDYEILEIGFFTADSSEGLTKEVLERRLVLLNQLAKAINDDLVKLGFGDEDGVVNTCSVAEKDGNGSLGANIVNLFLLADTNSDYAEREFQTDAEYQAKVEANKPKVREWNIIDTGIEINEEFVPNSNLTYMVEFDGVDRFCANLEETDWNKKTVGYDIAPKSIHYTLNRPIEELTQADKECILEYRGLDSSEEVCASDVFMEKSHITLSGVDIVIEMSVSHRIIPEAGENAEDLLSRGADIYLHSAGEEGYHDKEDLGGQYMIKFS